MRAAAYIRVSTARQAEEGWSLAAQRERVTAAAQAQGHELVDIHEDAGLSGKRGDRPGLQAALAAADRGDIDVLVVPELDRFGRSNRDLHANFDRLDRAA